MTDKEKLQKLFDAALRDTSESIGKTPKHMVPESKPVTYRPPAGAILTPYHSAPETTATACGGLGGR